MHAQLDELLSGRRPVLTITGNPSLARAVQRCAERGLVRRLLPGIYCASARSGELDVRVAGALAAEPNAVVAGRAAAALTWWPDLSVDAVDCICPGRRDPARGYRWLQRAPMPDDLVMQAGFARLTRPALTVLDLVPELGGHAIDEALRRRAASLAQLWGALESTPGRPGNAQRRWLLVDSRDQPWSPAERNLHRVNRSLALPFAYATNFRVQLAGTTVALDLALPELLLGFEVDGYRYHGTRSAYEYDRDRNSELASIGWQIVNYSAAMVEHQEAEVARRMRSTILSRAALFGYGRTR